ncbi:exonuclease domain-containing protein [Cellulomonas sp. URHB0016]
MSAWWEGPLVGFRLETTGPDVESARIVAAEITVDDPAVGPARVHHVLVDPGVEIPEPATRVHGITTSDARENGLPTRDGIAQVVRLLASTAHLPLVVSGGTFDLTVVDREARRHGLDGFEHGAVIDPRVLDKHLQPGCQGRRTLREAAEGYGLRLELARTPEDGALPAIRLARALGRTGRLPADAAELHRRQVAWRGEQVLLQQYAAARSRWQGVVPRQWPVIDVPVAWAASRSA